MYGQGGGGYDPQYNNYNDPYNQQPPSGGPQQQQQPPPHQQTQQQGAGVNSRSGLYKYILLQVTFGTQASLLSDSRLRETPKCGPINLS